MASKVSPPDPGCSAPARAPALGSEARGARKERRRRGCRALENLAERTEWVTQDPGHEGDEGTPRQRSRDRQQIEKRVETRVRPVPSLASRRAMQLASRDLPVGIEIECFEELIRRHVGRRRPWLAGCVAREPPGSCGAGADVRPLQRNRQLLRPTEPVSDLSCVRRYAIVRAARGAAPRMD